MALSTTKVEYVVACSDSYEAVWLRKILYDLFDLQLDSTCIYCNNHSFVKLSENPVFHDKLKHIEIKYHYQGYGAERSSEALGCCDGRADSRCIDQVVNQSEV